jgi:hypothetical protein
MIGKKSVSVKLKSESRTKTAIKRINAVQGFEYTNADDIYHEITRISNSFLRELKLSID